MSKKVARLYQQFQPENYDLHLLPDRDAMAFTGTVTIKGKKVGRPSKRITLHQKALKITSAQIIKHTKAGDTQIKVDRVNNQNTLDEVRLHSDEMIYPGSYTLKLGFKGKITKPMNGIYPCDYKDGKAAKKLIATQFESHYAREAFPCIDEPEAKATFDLSLTAPAGETALANTPIKSQKKHSDTLEITFETTPRMSSYLLAFVYGEMDFSEAKTKSGVVIRTYATKQNRALTQYSADVAVKILEFFEDYFGITYPLEKLDMVALPDFSAGAMENWGLITYRESILLVDEKNSSIETKQLCALVIAHELSHQWFGNLVTMRWWDDLWLNESFANMMEYRAVDAIFPEWKVWELFISQDTVAAMRRDSLADVQPVKVEVKHPDEISTLFDPSIVYAKGGNLLYMLMNYVGEGAFREGLQKYFQKHAYNNTSANDLWDTMSLSSGQDISAFMNDWLERPGYPIVTVTQSPNSSEITLEQQRFLSDGASEAVTAKPWAVPLAANQPLEDETMVKTKLITRLVKSEASNPLLLNHEGRSYFLPYYSELTHLSDLAEAMSQGQVSTIDRFQLLNDYILLQRNGIASSIELLKLLGGYKNETETTVWSSIAMVLGELHKLVETDDASEKKLDKLSSELVANLLEELGWDDHPGETAQKLRLRSLAYSIAAGAKVKSIIDEGLVRARAFKHPSDLSPSTRSVVFYIASRYGSEADFKKLLDMHNSAPNADERDEIAGGLSATKSPSRYGTLIDMFKSDNIRRQDLMHWYVWLLRNKHSRKSTWKWLSDNWDWVEQEFSSDKSYGNFARYAGSVFTTEAEFEQFQKLFNSKRKVIALSRDIKLAEQEMRSRIAWRKRNESDIKAYLAKL